MVEIGLWVTVEIGFEIGFLGFNWCFVAVGCCGSAGWGWVCVSMVFCYGGAGFVVVVLWLFATVITNNSE